MKLKNLPFLAVLFIAATMIVGCGNDDKDPRLSNEDIAYIKQKRLQELYGLNNTTTSTSTVVQYVTVTNMTTVTR